MVQRFRRKKQLGGSPNAVGGGGGFQPVTGGAGASVVQEPFAAALGQGPVTGGQPAVIPSGGDLQHRAGQSIDMEQTLLNRQRQRRVGVGMRQYSPDATARNREQLSRSEGVLDQLTPGFAALVPQWGLAGTLAGTGDEGAVTGRDLTGANLTLQQYMQGLGQRREDSAAGLPTNYVPGRGKFISASDITGEEAIELSGPGQRQGMMRYIGDPLSNIRRRGRSQDIAAKSAAAGGDELTPGQRVAARNQRAVPVDLSRTMRMLKAQGQRYDPVSAQLTQALTGTGRAEMTDDLRTVSEGRFGQPGATEARGQLGQEQARQETEQAKLDPAYMERMIRGNVAVAMAGNEGFQVAPHDLRSFVGGGGEGSDPLQQQMEIDNIIQNAPTMKDALDALPENLTDEQRESIRGQLAARFPDESLEDALNPGFWEGMDRVLGIRGGDKRNLYNKRRRAVEKPQLPAPLIRGLQEFEWFPHGG